MNSLKIKKAAATALMSVCCLTTVMPTVVYADSVKTVTLGADLTADQKNLVLSYFGIKDSDKSQYSFITINNEEERDALKGIVPTEQIGTKTYSCAYIEPTTEGGINVETTNLTYVTDNMIGIALAKYDNSSGYYFSICDEHKNVISSKFYRNNKDKVYFALKKGAYYLKVTPKSGVSDSVFYLTTTTNYYASKNNFSTETALLIDTDTKYTDVLYNGEAITQKVVYKLEVDKPISAKIKTDVRFGGNAYIGFSGQGISQKILEDYQILQKGTYYLTFSKRSVSNGGIVAFKVLKK